MLDLEELMLPVPEKQTVEGGKGKATEMTHKPAGESPIFLHSAVIEATDYWSFRFSWLKINERKTEKEAAGCTYGQCPKETSKPEASFGNCAH